MVKMFLAIRNTIVRLWNFGTGWLRFVIRAAILGVVFFVVIPLLVWPFMLLSVSFVDWHLGTGFTAVAAFLPLAAFLIFIVASITILVVAYPLLSGILVAIPEVRSFLGWLVVAVAIAVFGELVIGLYLAFVPVWAWPWLFRVLVLSVVVLGMFLILKRLLGWQRVGWVTTTLVSIIVVATPLFFPAACIQRARQRTTAQAETPEAQAPAPPSVESVREIVRIPLMGEDVLSEVSLRSGMIPPRWYYYFEGLPGARIHFDDGTNSPITQWVGLKNGAGRFTGPRGSEVVVRAYPPPSK